MSANDEHGSGFSQELEVGRLFEPATREAWQREAERSLKGRPLESLGHRSHEGLTIAPIYGPGDSPAVAELPGLAPFVRGGRAVTRGGWEVCQTVRDPEPATAGAAIAGELARGVGSFRVVCDRSLRSGRDLGDLDALDGAVLGAASDLEEMLGGVDLAAVPIRYSAGARAFAVAALHVAAAARLGFEPKTLRGSFGCDPLAALAEGGELPGGLDRAMTLMADLASWTREHAPGVRAVEVSTLPYHLAGATAVQEIAYTLATGVEYLRHLERAGMPVESASLQMRLVVAVGRDLLMEIAKLRALRFTWSRMVEACGGSPEARRAPVHAVTSPRTLTVRDPWVNILRGTVATFAAAVGGADVVTCLPFDAAIGPPAELARRVAANTHTVIREEAHLDKVADPAGGSWALERLTDDLANAAWAELQRVERHGGMAAALQEGLVREELLRVLGRRRAAIASRREPVTGVSTWPKLDERPPVRPPLTVEEVRGRVRARVAERRTGHEPAPELVRAAEASAATGGSLFTATVEAATAGATLTGLWAALAGDHQPAVIEPLPAEREAEAFERLRDASDAAFQTHGSRPRIFLANLGPVSVHTVRATFARNLFAAGGIEAVDNEGFESADEAVAAFRTAATDMAVICSSDEVYVERVPEVAAALKRAGAKVVVVAGRPGEHEASWRDAGVDRFVFLGCDVVETLRELLVEAGVLHG